MGLRAGEVSTVRGIPPRERSHSGNERARIDRFRQVQLEPGLERLLTILFTGKCRERCGRHVRGGDIHSPQPADQRVTVLARHGDVGEQHVHLMLAQHVDGFRRRRCRQHLSVAALQVRRDDLTAFIIVIHNQNADVGQRILVFEC